MVIYNFIVITFGCITSAHRVVSIEDHGKVGTWQLANEFQE